MPDEEQDYVLPATPLEEPREICFELANGHAVRLAAADWHWGTFEELVSGIHFEPYLSIRIYSNADTWPPRMVYLEEFCEGSDFSRHDFLRIWSWLEEFCSSRAVYEFDDLQEFIDHISDQIIEQHTPVEDAVDHYKRLPHMSQPEAFDKVDDSIFNDHHEVQLDD